MKLVFCGTPQFAVPTLEALARAHEVALVVTQPDRPRGRGMEVELSPVKRKALELELPVLQPEKIKTNEEFRAGLERIAPDAIIVVGYGRLIPRWMLDLPRHGNLNLHASLLPKYRGAAPIQWAIARGESVTGNTIMRLDEGLDTGPILLQREEAIRPDDTTLTLSPRLAAMGAELMLEALRGLEQGAITPRAQDEAQTTLAPLLKKEDGLIDWGRSAAEIRDRMRGFQPWPGAYTSFRGKTLNITAAAVHALPERRPGGPIEPPIPPGVLRVEQGRLLAGCGGNTALELTEVQPEGKRRISARDFLNGYRVQSGDRVG
jgi:methionyl-tRNA formyltransferase